mmetsp:Transcript_2580/g.7347  ORF Transcript_2580/g.7347 Transcript_2580/m.7347 type:complete len:364 (+) Transcript_2580:1464-2555(+)
MPHGLDAENGGPLGHPRLEVVVGSKDGHWAGEDLVVDEACVHAKEAVEEDHIATAVAHLDEIVELLALERCLVADHVVPEEHEQRSVAKISEHDAEEEGEEDNGEGAGIHLAIAGGAVRVDEGLEAAAEGVHGEVRGRRGLGLEEVEHGARLHARTGRGGAQSAVDLVHVLLRDPRVRNKHLAAHVVVELVEGVVDHLLLADDVVPRGEVRGALGEHGVLHGGGGPEDLGRLLESLLHLRNHGRLIGRHVRVRVQSAAKVGGDLGDLGLEHLAGDEDHEEVLLHLSRLARLEVVLVKGLVNGARLEHGVAAGGAEDDALEGGHAHARHDARHVAEHGGGGCGNEVRELGARLHGGARSLGLVD